jgi:endoglucanase
MTRKLLYATALVGALVAALVALTAAGGARPDLVSGTPTSISVSPTPAVSPEVTPTPGTSFSYWHTSGDLILDALDHPVRIAAVNWFGMEDIYYVPAGLEHQPLDKIVAHIHAMGFNAIRLQFSNEMVEKNPIVQSHLEANPSLRGLHALQILDRIVLSAQAHGLRIILDNQRSSAGTRPEQNGLWYTPQYPETAWIRDWITLVRRYEGNPTVVAVDLRNEPHTGPPGPWSLNTYLHQGSTWGPYRGKDNLKTDWRLAAERAGDAILKVNPQLLIMVEGLQLYPDATQARGVDSYWWGGVLQPARRYPIRLSVPHQLVYSPHEYGPEKAHMAIFGPQMTYATMMATWEKHWGFLEQGSFKGQAPIVIGEFGTCGTSPSCVTSKTPGSQGLWFSFLLRFLKAHPEIGWAYWAVNGTNHANHDCRNYILKSNWKTVRLPALIQAFRQVEAPAPSGASS